MPKPSLVNITILIVVFICMFVGGFYLFLILSYSKNDSYAESEALVVVIDNAVYFGAEYEGTGPPMEFIKKRNTSRCVRAKEFETLYPNRFHPYSGCRVVVASSPRLLCEYWWLGRRCLAVRIIRSTFEIPEINQAVMDAIKHPCKYRIRFTPVETQPRHKRSIATFGGPHDLLGCDEGTTVNRADVFLHVSGRTGGWQYFPTTANAAGVNRIYHWLKQRPSE